MRFYGMFAAGSRKWRMCNYGGANLLSVSKNMEYYPMTAVAGEHLRVECGIGRKSRNQFTRIGI